MDMQMPSAVSGSKVYTDFCSFRDGEQAFYAAAEQIEELKRSATFPKLTPPSPDFLGLMEEYVANTKEEGRVRCC